MKFKESAKHVTALVKIAKKSFQNNLCKCPSGTKNYWLIIKKLLGKKISRGIPALELDNIIYDSDMDKAQLFLKEFLTKVHHDFDESPL